MFKVGVISVDDDLMRAAQRIGGLPLAVYVLALLVIPLIGLGALTLREIDRNDDQAAAAAAVADAAAVHAAAATLLVPLEVERIVSIGLVSIDELGLERSLVTVLTGVDFGAISLANAERLENSFESLAALLPAGSAWLGDSDLENVRQGVFDERSAVSEMQATRASVERRFDAASQLVDDLLMWSAEPLELAATDSSTASGLADELNRLVDVVISARNEADALASLAFSPGTIDESTVIGVSVLHLAALHEASDDDPAGIGVVRSYYDAMVPIEPWMYEVNPSLALDPTVVSRLADALVNRAEYLDVVSAYSIDRASEITASVDRYADEAESRNHTTMLTIAALALASLVFGFVMIRSFASPLNRLRTHAERISRGELSSQQLSLAGPSDVRKVTSAMNEMASTLSLVQEHMHELARSDRVDQADLRELPGHVGASMRTSMERVTALTERLRASEARLAEEARIDMLTGLPNRFAVVEYLEQAQHAASQDEHSNVTGVMFVDIDGFKSVNDMHGHAVGDIVLREIARRLSGAIRDVDFVARLGGDEFLVVVDHVSGSETLAAFGSRLIDEIEQPYSVGDRLFSVSASIGATVLEPGGSAMGAVERADAAVYQAKHRGRRRVEMFDATMQRSIEHQAELELALRQAIQHDELRIHLQPIADMSTGLPTGAEVLVRWERPGVGLVQPGEFIPIAERSGLIFDLERWVLRATCSLLARWRREGRGLRMRLAVNISGHHLIEGDLLADLDHALSSTGADPRMLEIELTESHLLDDVERASSVLAAVRGRGVTVAIDDFGTGYSSMTYLQKLPVDVVKIDRSFIATATANHFDSTIVESVVTLGRALALEIVAEGIETSDQLAFAIGAGVTRGQGFLLARPVPVDVAEELIFGVPLFDAGAVRVGVDARDHR